MTRTAHVALATLLALGAAASAAEAPKPRDVRIPTSDGLTLAGSWWEAGEAGGPAVLLVHMYKGTRGSWAPLVPHLLARGLPVLAIDLRGHGGSASQDGKDLAPRVAAKDEALFAEMFRDVTAAATWLETEAKRDPKRIVLVGASVGGSVALDAARREPERYAGLLWATPVPRFLGLDAAALAKDLRADLPVTLLVHREEEGALASVAGVLEGKPVRRRVFDADYPPQFSGPKTFFHGVSMLGKAPLVESWIADWAARASGADRDAALLDGEVAEESAEGGAWTKAASVAAPAGAKGWARLVDGRRLVFAGTVPQAAARIRVLLHVWQGEPGTAGSWAAVDAGITVPGGAMVEGTTDASAPEGWPQPPVRVLFGEAKDGAFPFEGEATLPRLETGSATHAWVAVGFAGSDGRPALAEGVKADDPGTWTEITPK